MAILQLSSVSVNERFSPTKKKENNERKRKKRKIRQRRTTKNLNRWRSSTLEHMLLLHQPRGSYCLFEHV